MPVVRHSRSHASLTGGLEGSVPGSTDSRSQPVPLPRPGRRTFLQLRAGTWVAVAVGGLALGLAGAALWVALDSRRSTPPDNGPRMTEAALALPPALVASTPTVVRPVAEPPDVVPVAPRPASTAAAKAASGPPTKPAAVPVAPAEMPECNQLAIYDTPLTRLPVPELERRVAAMKYMSPSMMASQLQSIKATVGTFHPDQRECTYRAMLIRVVLNEKVVLASSPTLWGHSRDVPELERLFLEQALRNDWTPAQRKDVLRQVETLFIANLQKDAPGDDVYWRRMYYGILVACELSDDARAKVGAPRISENNCLKLKPAGA